MIELKPEYDKFKTVCIYIEDALVLGTSERNYEAAIAAIEAGQDVESWGEHRAKMDRLAGVERAYAVIGKSMTLDMIHTVLRDHDKAMNASSVETTTEMADIPQEVLNQVFALELGTLVLENKIFDVRIQYTPAGSNKCMCQIFVKMGAEDAEYTRFDALLTPSTSATVDKAQVLL